ncbi:MAG: DUF5688 family protein [Lachnospiraceae bacterium]|nr:DUF5688 family protein [Lachnospiraceae bacterium]
MYYQEFREELLQMMREQAEEKISVELIERQKLNGQIRYALLLKREGSCCAPVMYLEEVYEEFCQGTGLQEIAEKLWLIYAEEMRDNLEGLYGAVSCMQTYANAAPGLYVRIMHAEKNSALLADAPWRHILDLALTVYYLVEQMDGQVRGTVMLRDEHLKDWDVPVEEVFERAIRNTLAEEGLYWNTMEAVLNHEKLLLFPEKLSYSQTGLYILSGRTGVWGATLAFLPGTAAKIHEALGEPFYLLPSSIHEVILVPASRAVSRDLLAQTVWEVNRQEMPVEDILSDHIYFYNAQCGRLEIVEDME